MFFLLFLALMVFGPKRLPEMARKLGKIVGEFKRASGDFRAQIEDEVRKLELNDTAKSIGADFKQATQSVTRSTLFDDSSPTIDPHTLDPQILPPADQPAASMDLYRDNSFDAVFEAPPMTSNGNSNSGSRSHTEESESQHA
ncbi:MAG: twin-arginine translocase TatA/TatE family subunit [Acidobacteriaceae bacterium]